MFWGNKNAKRRKINLDHAYQRKLGKRPIDKYLVTPRAMEKRGGAKFCLGKEEWGKGKSTGKYN